MVTPYWASDLAGHCAWPPRAVFLSSPKPGRLPLVLFHRAGRGWGREIEAEILHLIRPEATEPGIVELEACPCLTVVFIPELSGQMGMWTHDLGCESQKHETSHRSVSHVNIILTLLT